MSDSSTGHTMTRHSPSHARIDRHDRKVLHAIHHQYMLGRREWRANFALFLKRHPDIADSFERKGNKISPRSPVFEDVIACTPLFQLIVVAHSDCFPTLASIQRIKRKAANSEERTLKNRPSTHTYKRVPVPTPSLLRDSCRNFVEPPQISTKDFFSQPPRRSSTSHKQIRESMVSKTEGLSARLITPSFHPTKVPVIELSTPQPLRRGHQLSRFGLFSRRSQSGPPRKDASIQTDRRPVEPAPTLQVVIRNEPMGDFYSCVDPNYKNKGNFALFKLSDYGRNIYKKLMAVMPLQPTSEEKSAELRLELEEIKKSFRDICFTPYSPSVIAHFIQHV